MKSILNQLVVGLALMTISSIVLATTVDKGAQTFDLDPTAKYHEVKSISGVVQSMELSADVECLPMDESRTEICRKARRLALTVAFDKGCLNRLGPVVARQAYFVGGQSVIYIHATVVNTNQSKVALCTIKSSREIRKMDLFVHPETRDIESLFLN
jgi:hypothetical protein